MALVSKLSKYIKRHERPYNIRVKNGKGIVEILFYDGYITIRSVQPGSPHFIREIHITRSAWRRLIFSAHSPLREVSGMMEGPDFDRYRAERRYAREEQRHLEELRAQKAERRGRRTRRPRRPRT